MAPHAALHPRPAWITCQNQGVNCTFSYSYSIFHGSYVDLEIHHPEHKEVTQYVREEGGGHLYTAHKTNKQTIAVDWSLVTVDLLKISCVFQFQVCKSSWDCFYLRTVCLWLSMFDLQTLDCHAAAEI